LQKIRLQNCTWKESEKRREEVNNSIIIPVGSTEQHGYHLPVGTDSYVAESIAEEVAQKEDIMIAPLLYYGWSPHHMVLPGTVTIRPEILSELLYDIINSLSKHGYDKYILLNGHRIVNIPWMQIAAERAKRELGVKVYIADPAYLSKELSWGKIGHADEIETSHMMYKYPELVQLDKAVDFSHKGNSYKEVDPSYRGNVLCYVPSSEDEMRESVEKGGGTSGKPTLSSKEKGEDYFNLVVENLCNIVKMIKTEEL